MTGRIFEVTRGRKLVWQYINPVTAGGPLKQGSVPGQIPIVGLNGVPNVQTNLTFRALRYPLAFAGLANKTLTPRGTIET